jgi:uncharacterized membrane protein (DUF106 family)
MNAVRSAREVRRSRVGGGRSLLIAFTAAVVLVGMAMAIPALALSTTSTSTNAVTVTVTVTKTSTSQSTSQSTSSQSTAGATVSLSHSSGGPGEKITITTSGLVANRTVSVTFNGTSLPLNPPTCATNSAGKLSGCYFLVPGIASGSYPVTVSDGTNSASVTFKVPVVTIPESTLLVTMTSVGLGLATQLVTRRVVNLDAERRMRAEVSAFNKEKREATLAKDKAKLEKLKRREVSMRQEQAKVSTARLKVTAITFVPLLAVYYLMASFLGGFNVVVAYSSIPIPYLVGGDGSMALFWWYMLSSFTFSTLLTKFLHTGT